ncbi:MAG: hypothetical protein ACTTJ1_05935 [Treponema sp.]
MKRIIGKLAGAVLAIAGLFSVAGCKNQLDYVNDTTALNKFNVLGLRVTGLDKSYNHADIALVVREKDDIKTVKNADGKTSTEVTPKYIENFITGKVADSFKENGETKGYKSGTAYIKLESAKLFDGDSFNTPKFECYLKVGDKKIKLLDGSNVKLDIPVSPAGTANADLAKKWVDVVVNGDYGTFSLKDTVEAPVNVTLYNIKLDILNKTEAEITAMKGVEVTTKPKTGTNQKYTLTIKGLKENVGQKVVLGGADISLQDRELKGRWYDKEKVGELSFVQEIKLTEDKTDATVSWTFYGSAVNGGNIAAWGRTYPIASAGPELKLTGYSDKSDANENNQPSFLTSGVSRNGTAGDSENFMFPGYTKGNYDVECVIDISKLEKSNAEISKDDPIAPMYGYKVAKITVTSKALKTAKAVIGTGKLWFMDGVLTGESNWNKDSPNFVLGTDISITGDEGTVSFVIPEDKRHTYFAKEMELVKTPGLQLVYLKAGKTDFGDGWTNVEKLLKGEEDSLVHAWKYEHQNVELKITEEGEKNYKCEFATCPIYISKVQLINAKDVPNSTKIYFLGGWVPNNVWNQTSPVNASITDGKATYSFVNPVEYSAAQCNIQIAYIRNGHTTFGSSWENVVKICPDSYKVENKYDLKNYILQFDAEAKRLTLEKDN